MIRHETARRIAGNWHWGQDSPFYQFASSGQYLIENHLQYLKEVERDLHPEYDLHPGFLSKKDEAELTGLKEFFIKQGEAHGIKTEWHPHSLYGYWIPYIAEDVPDELANKVRPIAYLK